MSNLISDQDTVLDSVLSSEIFVSSGLDVKTAQIIAECVSSEEFNNIFSKASNTIMESFEKRMRDESSQKEFQGS